MKNLFKGLIAAANEAIRPKFGLVCASNELIDQGNGWYLIPYGQYPHKEGLQILERADADMLIAAFNDMRGKDPTWKAAVYIGHPDHPDKKIADDYSDKAAYGWIDQVAANEAGFQFHCDWNPNGKKLVDDASYRYFSPLFWLQAVSNVGRKVIRPRIFQSIGLTNTPNMGGCWLANEKQPGTEGDNMNPLLERLKALINKPEIQTDDDVVSIFQRMVDALKKLHESQKEKWQIENVAYDVAENESIVENALRLIKGMDGLIAAANEAVPAAIKTQMDKLGSDLAAANTAAAGVLIDFAITQGKVLAENRDTQIAALASAPDLIAAANTLLSGKTVMKTAPKTKDLKVLDMSAAQRQDAQVAAANTIRSELPGLTYPQAWKRAKGDKRFADLFTVEATVK
jgi:phage I-like protein